jgi:hypothetical protein
MAKASEHASTVFNKIIIPVITTILGATAIYFLGFNKKSSASAAEIEKSTVNAWQSFVASENINYKTSTSISKEYNEKIATADKEKGYEGLVPIFRDLKDDLFRESKKLKEDIEEILKKKDDIDVEFVSMLNRTLDNINDEDKKSDIFVNDLISLAQSHIDEEEKSTKWQKKTENFIAMIKNMQDRSITEAEDISQALSKKYNRPFDLNDLLAYADYKKEKEGDKTDKPKKTDDDPIVTAPKDPNAGTEYKETTQSTTDNSNDIEPTTSMLIGEWTMNGGALELSKNGDMFWTFEKKGYTDGDWKLENGKLKMNATNPDTKKSSQLIGFLTNVTRNSFTMTFMTTPREVYNFTRKN